MKIEFDIYAWPTRETEDPIGLQGDVYVDGELVGGWTGPGDERSMLSQGFELLWDNWDDMVGR